MSQVLDTRDLQKRLEELQDEKDNDIELARDRFENDREEDDEEFDEEAAAKSWADDNPSEAEELAELIGMADEIPEWRDGETLIRDDYWEEYVEELCQDLGYLSKDFPSWIAIDWKETADNVAVDYSTITYQGNEYYYRNC